MIFFVEIIIIIKKKKKKQHKVKILIKTHNLILQKITPHCKLV